MADGAPTSTIPPTIPKAPLLRTAAAPHGGDAVRHERGRRHLRRLILSQMDLAGGTFAARRSRGRVVNSSIEAMRFLRAVEVGDEVSRYCSLEGADEKSLTVKIETWSQSRDGDEAEKVTEGLFTDVPVDGSGEPRPFRDG